MVESDVNMQDEIISDGISYYVMSNLRATSVTWVDDANQIVITGNFSSTDAKTMIISI